MKNKKIYRKKGLSLSEKTKLFYPSEFVGYIIGTMLFTIIALPTGIMIIVLIIKEGSISQNIFLMLFMIFLAIFPISASSYFIITIIELIRGKIYIEINNSHIKLKRFYGEKIINISDIKYVKKVSAYRNPFEYFTVRREGDNLQRSSRTIKFPTVWFSDSDIFRMVELLKSTRPSLDTSSFYTRVLRVRLNSKKKK